jgi:phosphoglycolate phosphatase-like HAD superfamily hydrolase
VSAQARVPIFDLDGTLLDSDEALVRPLLALGVARADIRFGEPVAVACSRLGVSLDAYVDAYDPEESVPFPGVSDLVSSLTRWAVCSNKHPRSGLADLDRWSWSPTVALFSDAFEWGDKALAPVLAVLGLTAREVVYVGDSPHDRAVASAAGCRFVVAGWNPRTDGLAGDVVLQEPLELLELLNGD